MKNRLLPLIKDIAENSDLDCSTEQAMKLGLIFQGFLNELPAKNNSNWTKEDKLKGGVALSSHHASACMFDHKRTAAFLRGTYQAIKELFEKFPKEKKTILYAGCGPLGPILIPLLPLFSSDELEVILLDYHQSSIDSVHNLITKLGLENYILEYVVADAVTYMKPKESKLHMVLTETMQSALVVEPQVAISLNLIPQIEPDGILVPERIKIELACADYSRLPFLRQNEAHCESVDSSSLIDQKHIILGTALRIEKGNETQFSNSEHNSIKTNWKLPEIDIKEYPDLCLFTTLEIFDETKVGMAETMITNPYCLTNLWRKKLDREFCLTFDFTEIPHWYIENNS